MEANLEADELPAGTPDMDAWAMGDAVAHKLVRLAQSRWSGLSRSVTPAGPVAGGVAGIPWVQVEFVAGRRVRSLCPLCARPIT